MVMGRNATDHITCYKKERTCQANGFNALRSQFSAKSSTEGNVWEVDFSFPFYGGERKHGSEFKGKQRSIQDVSKMLRSPTKVNHCLK